MCKSFGWSWRDLQATPLYVRRTWWEYMQLQAEAEQRRHNAAK